MIDRYSRKELKNIWADKNKYKINQTTLPRKVYIYFNIYIKI